MGMRVSTCACVWGGSHPSPQLPLIEREHHGASEISTPLVPSQVSLPLWSSGILSARALQTLWVKGNRLM